MKNYIHKSNYFYGNKISDYGLEHGYVDYKTLAMAGDMVLCGDITKLFYNEIGSEYIEPEQVNGYIDNSDEIDELQEQIDELEMNQPSIMDDSEKWQEIQDQIDELQEQIDELQDEQDNQQEIFQYYIISDNLAEILKELTNEIVYYIEYLDIYIWGITHYGTSWDYVLTNIKIEKDGE
jgi:hypothetical protein